MTRDETIALWKKCEEARAQALSEGEPPEKAHEAAKYIWNQWANEQVRKRQQLTAAGEFKLGKFDYMNLSFVAPETLAENAPTAQWLEGARVDYHGVIFDYKPNFSGFIFPGRTIFGESKKVTKTRNIRPSVVFTEGVEFSRAEFFLDAVFDWSKFERAASFSEVKFFDIARFDQCIFEGTAWFHRAQFMSDLWMGQVKFYGYTDFEQAKLEGKTSFYGAESKGSFILNFVEFTNVPDFTQVQFQGAPRIDNIKWPDIRFFPGLADVEARDLAARYRAIRQLATMGQDHENEAKAFEGEVRSKRGPINKWYHPSFWYGILYDLFSDFGRSTLRPFLAWTFVVPAFAAFYLSQTEVMQRDLTLKDASWGVAAAQAGHYAVGNTVPCHPPPLTPAEDWRKRWRWRGTPLPDPNATHVDGLSEKLRGQTNARAEALHLAFRNAFVVLDGGSDASHRMYGCLYGLEMYAGQNPVPIVPSAVSTASAIQKLISGVLIFLFGLALRNMLKVK